MSKLYVLVYTFLVCAAVIATGLFAAPAPAGETKAKIPLIHSTDLLHPHDDPDDHYDLATVFALGEFDLKGIILDTGRDPLGQVDRCGRPAVEQMMHITGRKVPCAISLNRRLASADDKALDGDAKFQAGVELLISLLREANGPVVYHAAGSMRDLAAAYNREPELLKQKLKAVYIEIGRGPRGEQKEWNVTLDPFAFAAVIGSDLPVYWCPCFGTDGYQTLYKADQATVVGACARPVQNFFVYCLTHSTADPIEFLAGGPHPLPAGERAMWCTAPLLYAAGRKIYERGPDDFVALPPERAEKAGLADKAVEVFGFVPMRAAVSRLPELNVKDKKWVRPEVSIELNPAEKTNSYIFRVVDRRYTEILPSVLKNLLSELGRDKGDKSN